MVHISFNVLGVLVWLPFLPLLARLAALVSPDAAAGLEGSARLAVEVPREIANANTLFNVFNTVLFIGSTGAAAGLAVRLVPERALREGVLIRPQFLDKAALKAPAIALENVRREFHRAGQIVLGMMEGLAATLTAHEEDPFASVARRADEVRILDAESFRYLGEMRQALLTDAESGDHEALMAAMVNLESAMEVLGTEVANVAKTLLEHGRGRARRVVTVGARDG